MSNKTQKTIVIKTVKLTDAHLGRLLAAVFANFQKEKAEGELEPRREDVGHEAAEGDDPTPTTLGVIMLTKSGRFTMTL